MLTRLYFWALAAVTAGGMLSYYLEGTSRWGRLGHDWDLAFGIANLPADRLPSLGGARLSAFAIACVFWACGWTAILLLVHFTPHDFSRATETPAQQNAPAPGQTS